MKRTELELSIIITTWNCRRQIEGCLESLGRQNYKDYEIIVIDQASRDGTKEYLKSVSSKFNLRLICRETKGTWADNNWWGVSMAKGQWLAISNPDIVFPDGSLKELIHYAHTMNGDKPFIGCHLLSPDGGEVYPIRPLTLANIFHVASHATLGRFLDRKLWRRYFERHFNYQTDGLKGTYSVGHLNASFFMVHRETVEKMGRLWDEKFRWACADSDMFERGRSLGIRQVYNHEIRLIHEGEHSRRSTPKPEYEYEYTYGFVQYAKKWGHATFLRLLFSLDAIFSPILLLFVRVDGMRNQIKCSASKFRGLLA